MRKLGAVTGAAAMLVAACGIGQQQGGQRGVQGPATIEVRAVEYAFEGLPPSVAPEKTTFVMRNVGKEPHMMSFARIEGTTKSLPELLRLPEKKSSRFVEEAGGIRKPVAPEKTGETTLDLEPGRYVYVCFVSAPDGDAHYEKGMVGEFEVART